MEDWLRSEWEEFRLRMENADRKRQMEEFWALIWSCHPSLSHPEFFGTAAAGPHQQYVPPHALSAL